MNYRFSGILLYRRSLRVQAKLAPQMIFMSDVYTPAMFCGIRKMTFAGVRSYTAEYLR